MTAAIVFRDFGLAHRRPGAEEVLLANVHLELPSHGFYLISTSRRNPPSARR
jgi:hypothetical protein